MLTVRGAGVVAAVLFGLLAALFTLNLAAIAVATFFLAVVGADLLEHAWALRVVRPSAFEVARTAWDGHLEVGEIGVVRVRLAHPGSGALRVRVEDPVPPDLPVVAGATRLATWWPAGATLTIAYAVQAPARGTFALGPTVVRFVDLLGLAERRVYFGTEAVVRVPPEVPDLRRWTPGRRTGYAPRGSVSIARRGYGTEFRSLRPYVAGDDYRAIAWQRSRPGELLVREFEAESQQDILVAICLARPMAQGARHATALDRACEAAIVLASYAERNGDRLGVYFWGEERERFLPPGHGPRTEAERVDALCAATARGALPDPAGLLRELGSRLRQPTQVFLFAPVLAEIERWHPELISFQGAGHRLALFSPDPRTIYGSPTDELAAPWFRWIADTEGTTTDARRWTLERAGIPVHLYGSDGPLARLLAAYQHLHRWGTAR